ncbi:Cof-type HAD-IIB family hydrolase [Levilactobacillus angrenensis]|uniref:Cof-type HAD-IIB family hydrolase n=1 Tax=Levilactobacillus angrenensis TaxID=2486020 RepID=A0ABW1U8V7_9LACO|nr:Cof-type HAD-IIB family hydrolase [Levilactobacillus angrenensis]
MYQAIVFFDLDSTLFDDHKNVLPASIAAIHEMQQHHILPVIATGRNIFEIQYVLDATGIDSVVGANGSYVQFEGKRLTASIIDQSTLDAITAFANAHHDPLAYYNRAGFRLSQANADTTENFQLLRLNPVVDPEWYQHQEINFINVFNRDKDQLYHDEFAGQLDLVRNNPRCLDTMVHGVSKQSGIRALLAKAGLQDVKTYAFGDGYNDLQMFDEVDVPISMGNGVPEAKAKAAYVTTSNTTDGIVHGLRHFGLIQ